jgi:hypothetical protein
MARREGIQLQSRKVDNAEDINRHIDDSPEGEGFQGGRMYDIRERILQFTAEAIPIPSLKVPQID